MNLSHKCKVTENKNKEKTTKQNTQPITHSFYLERPGYLKGKKKKSTEFTIFLDLASS